MKIILLVLISVIVPISVGYCQGNNNFQNITGDIDKLYNNSGSSGCNVIGGLSMGKLIGSFLFSSIGFIVFLYGKRTVKFKPLIIGMVLMGYPYFINNTMIMYIIGVALTTVLFIWRN